MTEVWATAKGSRYHRTPHCDALAEGQSRAAAEGRWTYTPRPAPMNTLPPALTPCSVCWAEISASDPWLFIEHAVERQGDSHYEFEFLSRVLRRTPGLDPDYVVAQHWTPGKSGRQYRLDFAVLRPGRQRLAIEIDGFEKSPGRTEADSRRQDESSLRGNDLNNAGWKLLHFTNRQVVTQSGDCRRVLEEALTQGEAPTSSSFAAAGRQETRPPREETRPSGGAPVHDAPVGTSSVSRPPTPPSHSRSQSPKGIWLGAGLVGVAIMAAGFAGVALAGPSSDDNSSRSTTPSGSHCPGGHPVKGNVNDSGERIFHEPGWRYYAATWPEQCFADANAAADAGYRASTVR